MITTTIKQILSWPTDAKGWHVDPVSGTHAKIGADADCASLITIGNYFRAGNNFWVGNDFVAGNYFRAGNHFQAGYGFWAGNDFRAGNGFQAGDGFLAGHSFRADHGFRVGNDFRADNDFQAGDNFRTDNDFLAGNSFLAGSNFQAGDRFRTGDGFRAGNDFLAGSGFRAGDNFRAGSNFQAGYFFRAGNGFTVGNNFDSLVAVKQAIAAFAAMPPPLYFIKWVVKREDGTYWSPGWGGYDRTVRYVIGQRLCVEEARVSDQQCAPGLHVFRVGTRPEHCGLAPIANLVPLLVEVPADAICFAASWTGQAEKLRVRELTPVRELYASS